MNASVDGKNVDGKNMERYRVSPPKNLKSILRPNFLPTAVTGL
jgi:hypothetical protein